MLSVRTISSLFWIKDGIGKKDKKLKKRSVEKSMDCLKNGE